MFDAEFFRTVLQRHITQKAKDSREGVVTLEIHLQFGALYTVSDIIEAADAALIVEVYPDRGPAKKTGEGERKLGAPLFELDRVALAYSAISQVVITTRRARKDVGFSGRV